MKTWFAVKLLFRGSVPDPADPPMLEESIRLFKADSEEAAQLVAEKFGEEQEHQYHNEAGEVVSWRFVEVLEIQDLCETNIEDGIEVFSRMFYETIADREE